MYHTNKHARTPRFSKCADNIRYGEETIPVFARWFSSWQVSVQRLAFSSPELAHRYDQAAPGWGRALDRLGYPDACETLLRRVLSKESLEVAGVQPHVLDCVWAPVHCQAAQSGLCRQKAAFGRH